MHQSCGFCPVILYLHGFTADDIVADEDVLAIYRHLGGENVPESEMCDTNTVNIEGSRLTVGITSGVLHSYEMYSPQICFLCQPDPDRNNREACTYPAGRISLVYAGWFLGLAGLLLTLIGLNSSVPFLLVGFYMVLKSNSGMTGQIQNMLLLYIFCVPMGNYIRSCTGNRLYGAVVSAFLFQTLMITSAALIALF